MAEIVKTIVRNFFFVVFFFWELCFFSHLYAYLELKSMRCSTSFCRQNDSQFDRKKELEVMRKKGNDFLHVVSSTWIIHRKAWTHSAHMQWWSRLFNKGGILAPSCLNIFSIFLYWVQKSGVEKIKSQLLQVAILPRRRFLQ